MRLRLETKKHSNRPCIKGERRTFPLSVLKFTPESESKKKQVLNAAITSAIPFMIDCEDKNKKENCALFFLLKTLGSNVPVGKILRSGSPWDRVLVSLKSINRVAEAPLFLITMAEHEFSTDSKALLEAIVSEIETQVIKKFTNITERKLNSVIRDTLITLVMSKRQTGN